MRKNENGYIEKRSSEFRGADRCKVLRNYDGLNGILDTVKESNFDAGVSLLAFEVYAFYIKSVARSFYSQLLLLWIPMRTKFPLCFLSAFFLMLFLIPFI